MTDEKNETRSLLPPKSDYIFKRIFGDVRNIEILRAFLVAALDIPREEYEEIEITDTHLKPESSEDKLAVLDVLVRTRSGMCIDIEIQLFAVKAMAERVAFYASRLIAGQMASGMYYDKIKKVVCIAILDYNLISDSDRYHNRYMLYDPDSGSLFTDVIEIHTMELRKLPAQGEGDLYNWLKFLGTDRKEEFDMIATKSPELKKAYAVLKHLSADERTRMEYEQRERARMDEYGRMAHAMEEGIRQEKIEIAKKMLARAMTPEAVADLTGLSVEEIGRLR